MSRSQLVAEHLPLLRRYARALTGNQASGDAYVGAMLEALLQDPSLLDEQHGPRAGLFRLFTQIWNSVSLNEDSDVAALPMPSERRLSNITALPRQAFLLLSLEGFSEEEVAFILATALSIVVSAPSARAATSGVLYTFQGGNDGANPAGSLIEIGGDIVRVLDSYTEPDHLRADARPALLLCGHLSVCRRSRMTRQ